VTERAYIFPAANFADIAAPESLIIQAGQNLTCLDLMITEDLSLEYDEMFVLSLEPVSEDMSAVLVVGNGNTSITIINDDCKIKQKR
jgi:hypothetical protein